METPGTYVPDFFLSIRKSGCLPRPIEPEIVVSHRVDHKHITRMPSHVPSALVVESFFFILKEWTPSPKGMRPGFIIPK